MTEFRPEPRDGQIIWHALGLDYSIKPHRKHFVAAAGSDDRIRCEAMASAGLMTPFGEPDRNGMQCFNVTAAGAELVGAKL
jgi:hypothetical protein